MMYNMLKKLCLIGFISIFMQLGDVSWVPIDPQGYDIIISHTTRAYATDSNLTANDGIEPDQSLIFQNRLEIYEFLVGVLLSVIGITAIALTLLRWKSKDLLVLSFGIFSLLYGARTNVFQYIFGVSPLGDYPKWFITYLVPVAGCIFVQQLIGKGWKSSIRFFLYCQIIFALAAISIGIYNGEPSAAWVGNNLMAGAFMVVLFINLFGPAPLPNREMRILRVGFVVLALFSLHGNLALFVLPDPFNKNFEPVGLLFIYCCLGYIVALRFFQNEKELVTFAHELETARQIQAFILPQDGIKIRGIEITARYVPMAAVAGDFYDFLTIDQNRIGILVADVSGHGVPASLIASMVKIAFASQTPHATEPARVLAEVNRILCGKLESDFVTAGYLYIDTGQQTAVYAGAGHPPLLIWRQAEQKVFEYQTKGVVLGQFDEARYESVALRYGRGDRFFLYTDGILEATNGAGDIFGWERFKAAIVANSDRPSNALVDKLIDDLTAWSAKSSSAALDDDLTLVVVDALGAAK